MSALVTSSQTRYGVSDGTRIADGVAVVGKDGSNFQPAMDAATRPGYMVPCDGTNAITLVNSALLPIAAQAATTGGATPYSLICANTNNATVVKASAGTVYAIAVHSAVASVRYLKLYDMSTSPANTDTPVLRVATPATAGLTVTVPLPPCGVAFASGIGFRVVTDQADNGTTSPSAGDVVITLIYK